ncbi:uncharacterized protein DUF2617 [Actinocorallia herbida]|uniref:Uncharacterized protein DUF2617 n=1 Tax=Actinocorallia herbida TaxID=58109 RepID=A0A3N1CNX9_9ACTN|nr:DUF2617 family protein [Actinocorallia herbida]ROO82905.1 uncharacterized protein DUF2617 [Actinocorallia herbida]
MLELSRPDVEVVADDLAFTLDEPPLDPLAVRGWRIAGVDVQARLLPAGFQVVAGEVVETVAQLPGRSGPLPYHLRREVGGWSHVFTADVYRRDYADFTRAVAFLRRYLTDRDDSLAASFPGRQDVLCGVLVRQLRRGIEWRGWYTFPETRQVVSTRSRLLIG